MTTAGGSVFEKRYGRDFWRRYSTSTFGPVVKPPCEPPSALPSVEVYASIFPKTPSSSGVPRPVLPRTPVPCDSSTTRNAPYSRVMLDHLRQRRERAFHREHAVGHHQLVARVLRRLERAAQIAEVAVLVALLARLRETHAVDDRGVIQLVGDDRVLLGRDGLEQPFVRVPARAVEDRVLGAEELRDLLLELAVDGLRAADEAHRREAVAVIALRLLRRLDDRRMIGQAEVVVRGEHDHLADPLDVDDRRPADPSAPARA